MPSNSDLIVQQLHADFHALLTFVSGPEAHSQTAYTVELTLFRRLLALGAALLKLFFLTRAATRPAKPVTPTGTRLRYHDQRPISYYSVFGKLQFARHYFSAPGQHGVCPLDAALSLPAHCYSDLLRDWATFATTDAAFRESQSTLERILGLSLSVQALESSAADTAQDSTAFYVQPPDPAAPAALAPILVVQADGKGVPMVQPLPTAAAGRLGKGQKRSKKKEAVVTSCYTIAPYRRTPQDVVAALLHEDAQRDPPSRPRPIAKEVHATLEGKEVALQRLATRVRQREGAQIQERVALTDGAEALQERLRAQFPEHTLVLDIIHATEYLWDAANALLGETHPERTAWVRRHLEQLLSGQTEGVITALERAAAAPNWSVAQRTAVQTTVGYYRRNQPYMHYDVYLAHGWPIGTGVVEGACGHLVKDRMEQAGMRWTQAGAQAVLDLRAVRLNGDWDAYWHYHRQQQHTRLYGASLPTATAEAQVLQLAA
ncbi:MAG: ISKra4 family transposase [Chloroflexi bacterium]|nr:ISKra4 family transposase [Chloroflexota bacterium]